MSEVKHSKIKLGVGAYNNRQVESEWIVGTAYGNIYAYNLDDIVIFNAVAYKSLQNGNTANQPDISPSYWVVYGLADGGYFFQVPAAGYPTGGTDVNLWYMSAGTLYPFILKKITVSLIDGQLSPADALTFPAGVFTYAKIEYTITRGSGSGRQRAGELVILNDGSGTASYTNEFQELGSDVNVEFSITVSGGLVHLQYTTDATEGVPISLSYILTGWA